MTSKFDLGVIHTTSPHLLADLAELTLIVKYNGLDEISQSQLLDIAREGPAADDEIDEVLQEDELLDDVDKKDRQFERIEDCWTQLEYRASIFDEYYPFVVGPEILKLRRKLTPKHKLYIFLVICSRLRSFPKTFSRRAAQTFVDVSAVALQSLAGPRTNVKVFDANSSDRKQYYGTDLRKALKRLGEDLAAYVTHQEAIDSISSSGDAGLDLVAIRSFLDSAHGCHALFGQCAAREIEWPKKTLEASYLKLQAYFHLLHEPANLVFIPLCFRTSSGAWAESNKTSGCLLIDRVRLIKLVRDVGVKAKSTVTACGGLVDEVLA